MIKKSLKSRALTLLSQREHSAKELYIKLSGKGFTADAISEAIAELTQLDLQSDQRFAEYYLHYRCDRGFGSEHIIMELKQRGVADDCIDRVIKDGAIDWTMLAKKARSKRFGQTLPAEYKARAKQQQFLQQRGFSHQHIVDSFKQ